MSLCLGIILPKVSASAVINKVKSKFKLVLQLNRKIQVNSLFPNESCYNLSNMDNSFTGIGSYYMYHLNTDIMDEKIQKNPSLKFIKEDFEERKRIYLSDAKIWLEIIKYVLADTPTQYIGLFLYNGEEFIQSMQRLFYNHNDLTYIDLMKIPMYTITIFTKGSGISSSEV